MTPLRAAALILLLCSGCKEAPRLPSLAPYKMDIQQGNVVTQEMVDKLKPGMTQSQVRFILGTPLVVDTFHKDRWDYVYRYQKGGQLIEHRRIVVVFVDDKLARIEGDVVAAKPRAEGARPEQSKAAPATGQDRLKEEKPKEEKPKEEKSKEEKPGEERGFFGRMLERLGF